MKHLLALLAFCAVTVPLLGATSAGGDPVVVVYPLTVTGNADPQAGGKVSALYAVRLTALGGVTVKAPAPGTDRQHFLDAARNAGADYYVTGYVSPLGNAITLINQVVSTHSGIQVWSDSLQVGTYNEATSQADAIRTAILRHAGRYSVALEATPAPAATATPAAKKNEANLNALFEKRPAQEAASGPSGASSGQAATASALTPSGDDVQVAVLHVIGKADAAAKAETEDLIARELTKRVKAPVFIDSSSSDFAVQGSQICLSAGLIPSARIFGGSLVFTRIEAGFNSYAYAKFDLVAYDCAGNVVATRHSSFQASGRTGDDLALQGAVKETFDSILGAAKKGKRG